MLTLSIIATIASIIVSVFVVFANGMSDAPNSGFQCGWIIGVAWIVTAVLYVAWYLG